MINNLMGIAKIDYKSSQAIIDFGGIFLVAGLTVFTFLQLWFFYILYDSYILIREAQIERFVDLSLERYAKRLQQKNGINSNSNCGNFNNNNMGVNNNAIIKEEEIDENEYPNVGGEDEEEKELCLHYTVI